jgi:hypothetical protein
MSGYIEVEVKDLELCVKRPRCNETKKINKKFSTSDEKLNEVKMSLPMRSLPPLFKPIEVFVNLMAAATRCLQSGASLSSMSCN